MLPTRRSIPERCIVGLQEAHAMFLDRGFQRLCHVPDEPVGDVDECDDLPPFQNQEPVVDAGLPSDSQPEGQMTAVFSDSTRATGIPGFSSRRCSPKRHWVSFQSRCK